MWVCALNKYIWRYPLKFVRGVEGLVKLYWFCWKQRALHMEPDRCPNKILEFSLFRVIIFLFSPAYLSVRTIFLSSLVSSLSNVCEYFVIKKQKVVFRKKKRHSETPDWKLIYFKMYLQITKDKMDFSCHCNTLRKKVFSSL